MNKPLRRIISATLALSLSVTLAVNAYAEEIEKVHKPEAASSGAVAVKENSEKAKKPEKIKITKDNLPEVLDFERVKGQGFVSRLKSEEQDMCEIILENEDGTRGLYVFDFPVKFKNKNGETVDKSNKVKPHTKNGAPCFKSESNDIEVHLPATIQGGVSLKDEEVNVSMKPIPSVASKRALSVGKQKDEDSVVYENVFDNFTDIVYTFTYDGVKEDIVLEKYNGKNTFDFEVITGGLSLEEEKGTLLLKDENGEVKATMGEIVIFSADNKNNTFGEYKITEKQKNNSYIITVCVDVAYLTSPDTKYPVTIDPTINSVKDNCGMQDLQVFKGTDGTGNTETSAGLSGVSRVGWTDWGACRTLVKFNSTLLSKKNITDPSQIIDASIEIRDLMAQSQSATIYCCQFNGSSTWSEADTKTWNQLQADKLGITAYQKPVSATTGALPSEKTGNPSTDTWELWHKFSLTNIVKKWTQKSTLISQGLIFKSEYETATKAAYMKTFSSMQGNEKYKPYFYIRYIINGCKGVQTLNNDQYTKYNCLRYAFWLGPNSNGYDSFRNVYFTDADNDYCLSTTVENALTRTKLRMNSWLNATFGSDGWRDVTSEGYTAELKSNEWLVCMRVGKKGQTFDYHFWYRANDGKWYNKHGWLNEPEEMVGSNVINPSTANESSGWTLFSAKNFYSSSTVYYAISA